MSLKLATRVVGVFVLAAGVGGTALVSPPTPPGDITLEPERRFRAVVTAYSSSPDETWGDPFITSSGRRVAAGVIACPRRFPFGTRFRIGSAVYTCWDRLHQRYDQRFDIWKATKEEALEFGRRRLFVEVL
jgi:3D (Asp-Asp-Asp) domain-containing protein